jgi:hypothetical protein
MQVGNVLIGICIGVIANAIGIFLGYWLRKAREKISESPLRNFWEPFLSDGGIIVIPPYPKNRSDFSVKSGTGYNDCIASGEIRKTLASLGKGKAIEVKEKVNDENLNLVVIGGPKSNPTFCELTKQILPPFEFRGNKIVETDSGKEYPHNEDDWNYGLLYLCKKHCIRDQTIILIAGCHGADTRKFGEILTTNEYIGAIMDKWEKQNYVSTVFILRYRKKTCTLPNEIVKTCKCLKMK